MDILQYSHSIAMRDLKIPVIHVRHRGRTSSGTCGDKEQRDNLQARRGLWIPSGPTRDNLHAVGALMPFVSLKNV
ncbi:unnamed protein product, partial [Ectocarpus sp. 12 AP-2014]